MTVWPILHFYLISSCCDAFSFRGYGDLKVLSSGLLDVPGKEQETRNEGAASGQITAWYSHGAYSPSMNRNLLT